MSELKSCPFCGGHKLKIGQDECKDYYVVCSGCLSSSNYYHSKELAVEAWNTRQSEWISVDDRLPKGDDEVLVYQDPDVFLCLLRRLRRVEE